MPRRCSVCDHPDRAAIDKALVAGTALPRIAALYRAISEDALFRHKAAHLPAVLLQAQHHQQQAHAASLAGQAADAEQRERAHALDVDKQLRVINQVSVDILHKAWQSGDGHTALKAIDRVLRQLELQARIDGQIDERPVVNVLVTSEWVSIRTTLLAALAPYPDARAAVAQQLMALQAAP